MKRYISFILVCVMLFTLLPVSALAETGSSMKASGKIMEYIKSKEGCELTAYKLSGEAYYTIGYGHYGPDVHKGDTITQAEADSLFAQDIKTYEKAVNGFADTYDLTLNQYKFDALVSFTYNCGSNWVSENPSWRIAKYLKNNFKDSSGKAISDQELADAFGVICNGGGQILVGLIKRRIEEAKIFLYGDYDGTGSKDFVYVKLDVNGGKLVDGNRVAIYTRNQPYGSLPEATKSGCYLSSWKSASGYYYRNYSIAKYNRELTAVWKKGTEPAKYTVTVENGYGSGKYAEDSKVCISPMEKSGYDFIGWSASGITITKSDGYYYFTMPAKSVTVSAKYEKQVTQYTLTVKNGSGGGKYEEGEKVYITPAEKANARFDAWECSGTTVSYDKSKGSYYIIMPDKSVTVTAKYIYEYTLTVNSGSGSGKYEKGTKVYISPIAKPGYCFVGWDFPSTVKLVYDNQSGVYCITMPAESVTVTAKFEKGCIYGEFCPSAKFIDVSTEHWGHEGIDFCVSNKLLTGTSSSTFSPEDPTTRAMAITALYRQAGKPSASGLINPYFDVTDGYYYDAVLWANSKNIIADEGYGMFLPDDIISREEFALILYRYANYLPDYDVNKSSYADLSAYSDSGDISPDCRQAMEWAVDKKIIIGMTPSTLEPTAGATRAQVATMLLRFFEVCTAV